MSKHHTPDELHSEDEEFYDADDTLFGSSTLQLPSTELESSLITLLKVVMDHTRTLCLEDVKDMMNGVLLYWALNTPSIIVKCNWASNIPGKSIKDTVKICLMNEENEKEEEELSDFLDIRNTVNFIRPNEVDAPTVTLKTEDPSFSIEKLVFYGDVKTVELFGNNEIYLDTVSGTPIQSSDEFNVLEYKISVKQQREITLKLVRLSNVNYFWIYAFLVKLKKNPVERVGAISYENVENLLKDINISEAAKNCLSFMKASSNNVPNLSNMSKLNEMFKSPSRQDDGEVVSGASFNEIKTYIDYKFQILTDLIIMREKHFADKLDLILEYIKTKKN